MMSNTIGGYTFKNINLLKVAMTHTSHANEIKAPSNQRLEFLGDSVLSVVVSDYIFRKFPNMPEGDLTRIRASVVCEKSLAKCSLDIGIHDVLLLGKGEEMGGGRNRPSILADTFEALIAAIFLDGGIKAAGRFILERLAGEIELAAKGERADDFKTMLQEEVQKTPGNKIEYITLEEAGPDHDRVYCVMAKINGKEMGRGTGKSKKEAEQNAAGAAYKKYENKAL